MTNFLIKIFIGKNKDENDPAVRAKYASLAGFTGILLNILLFAGKLTLGGELLPCTVENSKAVYKFVSGKYTVEA